MVRTSHPLFRDSKRIAVDHVDMPFDFAELFTDIDLSTDDIFVGGSETIDEVVSDH